MQSNNPLAILFQWIGCLGLLVILAILGFFGSGASEAVFRLVGR